MNFFLDIFYTNFQEFILLIFIFIGFGLSVLNKQWVNKFAYLYGIAGIISAIIATLFTDISFLDFPNASITASNIFTILIKSMVLLTALIILIISKNIIKKFSSKGFEYCMLLLLGVLGCCTLVTSNDFITAFISLEIIAVTSYLLTGFTKSQKAQEAALKYLIQSTFATTIFLFGVSYLYGISGSINFNEISNYCLTSMPTFFYPALGLIAISGLMFKIGAAPFTNWIPDIYEGASYPAGAYISLVPKIAGFGFLTRLISLIFPQMPIITISLEIIAVVTVIYGVFGAIRQTNIKRLLGYSSVIQSGFILAALAIMSVYSISSVIFYLIAYIFMNIGIWASAYQFNLNTGSDNIDDYCGLYKKRPYFSFATAICLISLAGLPITSGFLAKLYLFSAILKNGEEYRIILFMLLLLSIVAIFAYFNVIKNIFVSSSKLLSFQFKSKILDFMLYLCTTITILLCLMPNQVIKLAQIISYYIR